MEAQIWETETKVKYSFVYHSSTTEGAEKSLARPRGKQARKHVSDARDFNNIETQAVIKCFFFPARQGAQGKSTPF